jgi:3,4-dihydroxy 2-butanone 4-phosphate synthase/GTP cyclohydrolase II
VLSGEDTPEALMARLHRHPAPHAPEDAQQQEWRQHGLGAQMLVDLGVHKLRVLGTPRKLVGLAGFGLEVVEYV